MGIQPSPSFLDSVRGEGRRGRQREARRRRQPQRRGRPSAPCSPKRDRERERAVRLSRALESADQSRTGCTQPPAEASLSFFDRKRKGETSRI